MYNRQRSYNQNEQSLSRKKSKGILTVSANKYKAEKLANNSNSTSRIFSNVRPAQSHHISNTDSHLITLHHQTTVNKIKQTINGTSCQIQPQVSHNRNANEKPKSFYQNQYKHYNFQHEYQIRREIQKLKQTINFLSRQKTMQMKRFYSEIETKNQSIKNLEGKLIDFNYILQRNQKLQQEVKQLTEQNCSLKQELYQINTFIKQTKNKRQKTSDTKAYTQMSEKNNKNNLEIIEEKSDECSISRNTFSHGYSHIRSFQLQTNFCIEILHALNIETQMPRQQIQREAFKKIQYLKQTLINYQQVLNVFQVSFQQTGEKVHQKLLDQIDNFHDQLQILSKQIADICAENKKGASIQKIVEGSKSTSLQLILQNLRNSTNSIIRKSFLIDSSITFEKPQ